MKKLIYGVATNSGGKYKATIDGKKTKAHITWYHMLGRAYCPKYHARQPTYADCSVSDEWLEYQEFAKWFYDNPYSDRGYHLDKDLLLPGNKIYAPNRCVFVPRQLNSLLVDRAAARGPYRQGVGFDKQRNKFVARININGKCKNLGGFDTELDAYNAYKEAKEQYVKDSAKIWRDEIAGNVYAALMNWQLGDTKC